MKRNIATAIALLFCLAANADEGMWMINAINSALEKKMQERGLALSARDIYDADAEGATISDAIVSLEFSCTGSIISDNGLLITNHHCAFSDVFRISTSENNYLEDGFWAMDSGQERCIEGKKAFFLKKVIDITDEVEAFIEDSKAQGQAIGMRKLGYMMEKKYSEEYG
ncbi:MAG: S46 family peptidase, partial [Bacteroidales bacterium]|nr:S46 family peptidase [Bacteroidales bacterium]